ncbi:hypothetical protein DF185_09775 [Marinifilum breve]|uniref:Thoeris protein ThsB TIR-like domain-containing protein n=1 Tax=Marinifilum breve TaxID=2184082 RepID=A0A2V3ZZM8_9BACT|nr:TIR domain-containing protein [Marinifilum breve]PXY01743.1 hypothetical protein DF185_09775 [Marinifilum breve]
MAHKTFISYKYSEAQGLRDEILEALGDDATYYMGETSDSPDLTDTSTENIKKNLTDMMYGTSVTIVIISPNMTDSKWIDWEIKYCLKKISRKDRISQTNGVVGVIMEQNGTCDWIKNHLINCHGTPVIKFKDELLFPVIYKNRYNSNPPLKHCDSCNTWDLMNGSYITLVDEDEFKRYPTKFIDNAFDKSENESNYVISINVEEGTSV